ncbi:MAG: phospholipid carrier-dependent glycosyltransferase [Oscillospiraceae bacterium]|nr:phospholipid carrier-dependent glycosyltransferase [Oscillospiraceae bacterium]
MNGLRYVFPAATVAFLLLIFSEYVPLLRHEPLGPPRPPSRWHWRDGVCVLLLTVVYAAVAFLGLGDRSGVERFCKFDTRGEYAEITLRAPTNIGAVRYYSGLYMGSYSLQFSTDGETYTEYAVMTQGHADVFKWNDAELTETGLDVVSIRIIADDTLWLGELAIYDTDGTLLLAGTDFSCPAGCAALFDEQEKIPDAYHYSNSTYFDEIYHARTAYEHIENIYPYEITHPPLGKLILSIGIRLFGMVPFGWRFMGTLLGVLMLPALYVFLKKMFGGTAVPFCCTAIFAFDFMHYVQTRIATIDTYAVFFTILMYLFFWLYLRADRTRYRSWLPPLALSGLCFGLGAASKWTCLYAGGGLAVLWLCDRVSRGVALCRAGQTHAYLRETARNILCCLLFFLLIPAAVYYVSYWPYGTARGLSDFGMLFSKDYLQIVLDNQKYMFSYHSGVTATHPYSSVWWQWVLDIRPILYYLEYLDDGTHVSFGAWVNPMLCWGGLLAMLAMFYLAVRRRDRTALFIAVGYLAQLLPWVLVERVIFEYHYFPSTVFLLLALGHVFRTLQLRHPQWRRIVGSFTAVSLLLFAVFYPALRGLAIPSWYGSNFLKWFPTWPF